MYRKRKRQKTTAIFPGRNVSENCILYSTHGPFSLRYDQQVEKKGCVAYMKKKTMIK